MNASPSVLYLMSLSAACLVLFCCAWLPVFFGPWRLQRITEPAAVDPRWYGQIQRSGKVYRRRLPRTRRAEREPHPGAW
jgi:hypothetical protein